jgi:hypothetical protein
MSKQHSHTLDRARHLAVFGGLRFYQGEYPGFWVTKWLNGGIDEKRWSAASCKRIRDLLADLIELREAMLKDGRGAWRGTRVGKLVRKMDAQLRKYPSTCFYLGHNEELAFEEFVAGPQPYGESWAVRGLIDLANQGLLDRICQCACGKWYFARFRHQRSHSASCRKKLYEKTPEFREKRRGYMRKYYRLKMSGKVK